MVIHLFSGLAKWSVDDAGIMSIVADCATELPEGVANEDGTTTYTYTLRDGMAWSDGQPVTAGDFEFAWKRAAAEETGSDYGYMFEVIKGYPNDLAVTAIDDKTLEVVLATNVPYWHELPAFPTYMPVREDVVADEAWATDASTYISNGAYTMSAWDHNSVITMTKNENYWNAENVTMNELKFFLSDDDNNMLTNWKADTWMVIDSLPTNEIPAIKAAYGEDATGEYIVGSQIGTYYACWNINEPLLP
jgi:oligopeptide transport system substrate-binding protein